MRCKTVLSVSIATFIFFTSLAYSQESYRFERLWPVIPQPWYFKNPVSIEIDRKDNFYVVDDQNDLIHKFTPDGRFVTKFGTGYLDGPFGISVDNDEYVYVHSILGIDKFTSDGLFVESWRDLASMGGEFLRSNEIAVDGEGCVYLTDFLGNCVQKLGADGSFQFKWGSEGTGDGQFDSPKGIALDENGDIYVVDSGNRRIQKFKPSGEFVTKWSEWDNPDSGGEQFANPERVTADGKGHVLVTESDPDHQFDSSSNILRFTLNGEFVGESDWRNKFDRHHLEGVAVNSAGDIYVTNTLLGTESVIKCDSEGNPKTAFQHYGRDDGMFFYPRGICVDSGGNVYITDIGNGRVQKFDASGNFMEKWEFGEPDIEMINRFTGMMFDADESENVEAELMEWALEIFLRFPDDFDYNEVDLNNISAYLNRFFRNRDTHALSDAALDSKGNLYVCDSLFGCVHRISAEGVIEECVISNPDPGDIFAPHRIIVDGDDNLYISDYAARKIHKYNSNAEYVTSWGGRGDCDGKFDFPNAMALDSEGNIHIVDSRNDCVQKFDSNGEFLLKWELDGLAPLAAQELTGIAFDDNDNMFLLDSKTDRAYKYDPDGQLLAEWGGTGNAPGRLTSPESIAADKDGAVYIVDTGNNRIQKFKNVRSAANNKAIIVAGGGLMSGNDLWDTTQMCAHYAYRALTYQGFAKEDIHYLTSNTEIDLDGNGELDDVDNDATLENLGKAITEWPSGDTDNVILYFVDHGLEEKFYLTDPEKVSADRLKGWLGTLQDNIGGKIIMVIDACHSGSFLPILAGPDRIVITSTSADQEAHFITHGSVSFSNYFWAHIFNGQDIAYAFSQAGESMKGYQTSLIDGNGNGVGNETDDYAAAVEIMFSPTSGVAGEIPVLSFVPDKMSVSDTNTAAITAVANDRDGISKVWAEIAPAGYKQWLSGKPVAGLPSIELQEVNEYGRYEGVYDGFNGDNLTYHVSIFAMDNKQNISKPALTEVTVSGALRKKAIIFLGEMPEDDRTAMENNAKLAYKALSFQGYSDDDIYLLSPSIIPEIPKNVVSPEPDNLENTIVNLVPDNGLDLVLYMAGTGGEEKLILGGDSEISATNLDSWLDNLQSQIPGTVLVLIDADYSGTFLPLLTPPADSQRIVISSTNETRTAWFDTNGDISFSGYFWRRVLNGANIAAAFEDSRDALGTMFNLLRPEGAQLDDNGNGKGNEKSEFKLAGNLKIGAGIMLAGLRPSVGDANVSFSSAGNSLTVRTENTTASEPVEQVLAMIVPVDSGNGNCSVFDLEPIDGETFEGAYEFSSAPGDYQIAVFAKDTDGNVSSPKIATVSENSAPDIHEPDNGIESAGRVYPNDPAQRHNFHQAGDEDWVSFHALAGKTYLIRAFNLESDSDPAFALYDANNESVGEWDEAGDEEWEWRCVEEGIHYLQIRHAEPDKFGENTGYDFEIGRSVGPIMVSIEGTVSDAATGAPISGAVIKIWRNDNAIGSDFSNVAGKYRINLAPGSCRATAEKSGYAAMTVSGISIPEDTAAYRDFSLTSANTVSDSDGDGVRDTDDRCPNDSEKTEPGECGCGIAESENCGQTPQTDDGGGGGGCFISVSYR